MSADLVTLDDCRARLAELNARTDALIDLPKVTDDEALTYWTTAAELDRAYADLWDTASHLVEDNLSATAMIQSASHLRERALGADRHVEWHSERLARRTGEAGPR
jgi:hypothetical protein